MNRQPDLSPNIFRLLDSVIDGKPVSKDVLGIVVKLAGFDRGAVFLTGERNELRLVVSLGIKNDQKAIECLVRRSTVTASLPVEGVPDTTKLNWFRTARPLRGSFILSYATVAIVSGTKQYGILYLDSTTKLKQDDKAVKSLIPRLAGVMLAALIHDQIISLPTVSASDYLTSRSIQDLQRERVLTALKRQNWHVFSASQELGIEVQVLYKWMKRLVIQPARNGSYKKREMTRNL
jgi:hypothetical protein